MGGAEEEKQRIADLEKEIANRNRWIDQRDRRIDKLEEENERLRREIEKLQQAAKRQAAPFSKGEPKRHPQRRGRKPGKRYGRRACRPVPRRIDRMFEKNIMTFNPGWDQNARNLATFTDIRELQRQLKAQGVQLVSEADENTTGPASFIVVDPDGNLLLFDQHV